MILAEKIMKLRKQQGWSQEELAMKLGVSRQSVSKWESGASIPELDKILQLGELFGVSTDFLLKDDREDFPIINGDEGEQRQDGAGMWEREQKLRQVTLEEADTYMKLIRKAAYRIAAGVSACILAPIPLIVLGGMAEYGKTAMSEDAAGGIGMIILLLIVATAAAEFISDGMKIEKFSFLEKEALSLQYGIAGIAEQKKEQFAPVKRNCIVIGVMLCILGLLPLFGTEVAGASEFVQVLCVGVLLAMISMGTFLFVASGMIGESYDKLLEEGDYTREKKQAKKRTEPIKDIYWCLVVAAYLVVSFLTRRWDLSWIIFAAAGLVYAALCGVMSLFEK